MTVIIPVGSVPPGAPALPPCILPTLLISILVPMAPVVISFLFLPCTMPILSASASIIMPIISFLAAASVCPTVPVTSVASFMLCCFISTAALPMLAACPVVILIPTLSVTPVASPGPLRFLIRVFMTVSYIVRGVMTVSRAVSGLMSAPVNGEVLNAWLKVFSVRAPEINWVSISLLCCSPLLASSKLADCTMPWWKFQSYQGRQC